jgi:hypothetical protein
MSKIQFNPMLTPREMFEYGIFGGNYFGVDVGANLNDYTELFKYHFEGLDKGLYMGDKYSPKLNALKVRSGMSYEYWKEQGWMHKDDPFGWVEWWLKYDMGRRHEDDERQIRRWINFCGPNGRWRLSTYKKIHESGDWKKGKIIQQSLLQWGYFCNKEHYLQWCDDREIEPNKILL